MKKITIAILSIAIGALAIVGLARSGVISVTPSSSSPSSAIDSVSKNAISVANPKDTYYNEDLPKFLLENEQPYNVSYSSDELGIQSASKPTASGHWIANLTTIATDLYTQQSLTYAFDYVATNAATINTYFEGKDDSWGGSSGTSINTYPSGQLVDKGGYSYVEDVLTGLDSTVFSFYRISKYDFDPKRKFTIYASNNIESYGVFSFWLTDYQDAYKEVTLEVMRDEIIFATGLDPDHYYEYRIPNKKNCCDGFMHRYDIQMMTDTVQFSIDNQVVFAIGNSIDDSTGEEITKIPDIKYCKVQFGLLIPTDPFWSGTPQEGDKDVTVRVSQYEMYDPITGDLVLD